MENKDVNFEEKVKHNIEKILNSSGYGILIITFFGGMLLGLYSESFIVTLSTWFSGFISGILLIALGVIIELLKAINKKNS
ncbi:hypothetical protein KHQ82_02850 [Mycoplasmatota bacterium]|nr:hypothetical protein KHQ82_02850 [Mycoplasmatota bacterium]